MKKYLCLMLALLLACAPALAGGDARGALGTDVLAGLSDGGGSAVVSPESLYIALAMAAQGARGDTLSELSAALGIDAPDAQGDAQAIAAMRSAGVSVANAYFLAPDITLSAGYAALLGDSYGAEGFPIDGDIVARVNEWASAQTDGMIKELLTQQPDDALKLLLANALLLDAKWRHPFMTDLTESQIFHGAAGDADVDMMYGNFGMMYAQAGDSQIAYLPYEAAGLGMYVILPGEGGVSGALEELNAALGAGDAPQWLADMSYTDVKLSLPKAHIETGGSLKDALAAAGLKLSLDPLRADFSGMTADMPLYIGDVVQKCVLDVTEEGTRAAAVTAVALKAGSAMNEQPPEPVEMTVNRPYIMLIALRGEGDSGLGRLLFAAAVNDVN